MDIRIAGIINESIVDGWGIRYVVFTQGCPHNCKGCHNPETHDFNGGIVIDTDKLLEDFKEDPLLKGITFSGGEPFAQPKPLTELAKKIHALGKDVTCYTGYVYEDIVASENDDWIKLLEEVDVLIDGPFVLEKKNLKLLFRGSSNQRIIDVKESRKNGEIKLLAD